MIEKAPMKKTEKGFTPAGDGWFVIHASEAPWFRSSAFGAVCSLQGETQFPQIGVNIRVIDPGQPACLYHREAAQEDFLVLSGECRVLIEEQEVLLKAGHFVHCPAGTNHVFVGAGEGPCAILMIGYRPPKPELCYPVSPLAAKYGASVDEETPDPRVAYGKFAGREGNVDPLWPPADEPQALRKPG